MEVLIHGGAYLRNFTVFSDDDDDDVVLDGGGDGGGGFKLAPH